MITAANFEEVLIFSGFYKMGESRYIKDFPAFNVSLQADIKDKKLYYP